MGRFSATLRNRSSSPASLSHEFDHSSWRLEPGDTARVLVEWTGPGKAGLNVNLGTDSRITIQPYVSPAPSSQVEVSVRVEVTVWRDGHKVDSAYHPSEHRWGEWL